MLADFAGVSLAILVGTTLRVQTPRVWRCRLQSIPKLFCKVNTPAVLVKAQAAFATAARAELQRAARRTEARRLEEARIVQRVMPPMAPMDGADTEATATSGTLRAFGLEFFCCSALNSLIKIFEIYGNCVLNCFNIFFLMNFCSSYLVDPVYQIDCTVSRPDVRSPTLALSEGQGRFRGKDVG